MICLGPPRSMLYSYGVASDMSRYLSTGSPRFRYTSTHCPDRPRRYGFRRDGNGREVLVRAAVHSPPRSQDPDRRGVDAGARVGKGDLEVDQAVAVVSRTMRR